MDNQLSVAGYYRVSKAREGMNSPQLYEEGVWRIERQRLDDYIERLHEETKVWTEQHPLNHPGGNASPFE